MEYHGAVTTSGSKVRPPEDDTWSSKGSMRDSWCRMSIYLCSVYLRMLHVLLERSYQRREYDAYRELDIGILGIIISISRAKDNCFVTREVLHEIMFYCKAKIG